MQTCGESPEVDRHHYDEYGLRIPAKSWTQAGAEWAMPPDVMADPETGDFERFGRGVVGMGSTIVGHVMDVLWPRSTEGEWKAPGFMGGEFMEGNEWEHYNQERAEAERRAAEQAEAEAESEPQAPVEEYDPHMFDEDPNVTYDANGYPMCVAPYDGMY